MIEAMISIGMGAASGMGVAAIESWYKNLPIYTLGQKKNVAIDAKEIEIARRLRTKRKRQVENFETITNLTAIVGLIYFGLAHHDQTAAFIGSYLVSKAFNLYVYSKRQNTLLDENLHQGENFDE